MCSRSHALFQESRNYRYGGFNTNSELLLNVSYLPHITVSALPHLGVFNKGELQSLFEFHICASSQTSLIILTSEGGSHLEKLVNEILMFKRLENKQQKIPLRVEYEKNLVKNLHISHF